MNKYVIIFFEKHIKLIYQIDHVETKKKEIQKNRKVTVKVKKNSNIKLNHEKIFPTENFHQNIEIQKASETNETYALKGIGNLKKDYDGTYSSIRLCKIFYVNGISN